LGGTIQSIIGDLEKKDWRDILGIRYNKNGMVDLSADQRADLLIEIHVRVNQEAGRMGDPNIFRYFVLRVQREYFQN